MDLCQPCSFFISKLFSGDEKLEMCHRAGDLAKSSSNCSLCSMILSSGRLHDSEGKDDIDPVSALQLPWLCEDTLVTRPSGLRMTSSEPWLGLDLSKLNTNYYWSDYKWFRSNLVLLAAQGSPAEQDIIGSLRTDPGNEDSYALVRNWLNECSSNHNKCCTKMSGYIINEYLEPELPRRVIDIENVHSPRLVESKGGRGRYVALSHCWGTPNRCLLKTTKANYKAHCETIREEKLSQTFRDAIFVTRNIGLKFLWIDSLCTVQDDVQDWAAELDQVGNIFELAHLTISASTKTPESDGLFLVDPSSTSLLRLPYVNRQGEEQGYFFVGPAEAIIPNESDSALQKRGWVTQEWMLSRRLIHFTERGMVWRCREARNSEIGERQPRYNTKVDWLSIIWNHSEKQLTFERDRLASLQGLATQLQSIRSDQYVQGMWTGDIPRHLAWHANGQLTPNSELSEVPSWSWASQLGYIHPPISYTVGWRDACQLLSVSKAGFLSLRGYVSSANSFVYETLFKATNCDDLDKILVLGSGLNWAWGLRDRYLPWVPKDSEGLIIMSNERGEAIGWAVPDQRGLFDGRERYILLSIEYVEETPLEDLVKARCCVLVVKPSTSNPGTFVRLGMGELAPDMFKWITSSPPEEFILT